MKQKFDRLRVSLDEFAQQDEFPMLLVGVRSDELAYVLNFLQALEQTLPAHMIVAFAQAFESPSQWLDAMVAGLRPQLQVLDEQRAERGEPPAPALPLDVEDARCPADERLRALLSYLIALLPNPDDHRIVVALAPLECRDLEAFARLMLTIVPHPEIPAWLGGPQLGPLRIIVWDDAEHHLLRGKALEWQAPHVLSYTDDFSTPALTDAMSRAAGDRSLALPERMANLLQLAALDFSHERHADALDKYALLHEYYYQQGQPEMQALTLLGAGDTLHAAGDSVTAKLRLQQGIAVAMEHECLPALLNLLMSITGVSLALRHLDDAESYADSGVQVAAATLNAFATCDMLALRGDAQRAAAKLPEAVASYDRCRELCRTYEYFERWRGVLDSEIQIYAEAGRVQQQRELEAERGEVDALASRPRSQSGAQAGGQAAGRPSA